ncbi:hypothetical protein I3843_09G220500 [Carya illinoinensis]|nr:hypothetical protein I3843_09G220500 [Carya illinoinensis]
MQKSSRTDLWVLLRGDFQPFILLQDLKENQELTN